MKIISILITTALFIGIAVIGHCFSVIGPEKTVDMPAYRIRGTEYLPLTLVCDAYGINWEWDPISRTAELNKGSTRLRLKVDEYKVYANGNISVEEKPIILHKGAVCIPSEFLRTVFNRLFLNVGTTPVPEEAQRKKFSPSIAYSKYRIKKIILDAGHGGYDPGAIGRDGIKEKYIVLDITKKIKDLLENEGIQVILTRDSDRFIPLWSRSDIANDSNADLFISIHANASRTRRLSGFEVYYLSEAVDDDERAKGTAAKYVVKVEKESIFGHMDVLDTVLWDMELTENRRESIDLANCILNEVDSAKKRLKGAKFYVLKGAVMPAVLVEVGYISNREECLKLGSREYRTKIAQQITKGIMEYKRRFESSGGFSD